MEPFPKRAYFGAWRWTKTGWHSQAWVQLPQTTMAMAGWIFFARTSRMSDPRFIATAEMAFSRSRPLTLVWQRVPALSAGDVDSSILIMIHGRTCYGSAAMLIPK